MLVVLDNYYPAWKATVDGEPVPVHRANYTFRAVTVPAGEHVVELHYDTGSLRAAVVISLAVLALLLGVIAAGVLAARRRVATPAP